MQTFLETLAEYLVEYEERKGGKAAEGLCLVFPNRRSGLFFRKYYLSRRTSKGWLPQVLGIDEFTGRLSSLKPADPLELSFILYTAYTKVTGSQESYDEFYPWGEMMISDFNDIDKYLVDAGSLFRNISELKEIEAVFDYLSPEQKKLIETFWKHFLSNSDSPFKNSFLTVWKVLYQVYTEFRHQLKEREIAYEGMRYRNIIDELLEKDDFEWPWEKVWICGFNALSVSEKQLFIRLRNAGMAVFFWDYDKQYVEDEIHEAGHFMRANLEEFPPEKDFDPGFSGLSDQKNIQIISLPSDILQAKELYAILDSSNPKETDSHSFNKTAIVLGDETLLPAVLNSLPESIEKLNITMGFPVSLTPVYSFVEALLKMQLNFSRKKNQGGFYYKDILSVLNHQYIKAFYGRDTGKLIEAINRNNRIFLKEEEFAGDPFLSSLFKRIPESRKMTIWLTGILNDIMDIFPDGNSDFSLEKEYIYHIRTRLIKLKNLLDEQETELSLESFIRLFRKVLQDFRIPFQGEPLQGVQLMGILESRLLDFENVIFLSMNEGIMPASTSGLSYIPANLRFAFGLPLREDKDAIYAYYFYRLLQRGSTISVLYNSKADAMKSGEPSRYIHQINYLTHWKPVYKTRGFTISETRHPAISIGKTPDVLSVLNKYTRPEEKKYLSPSALSSYMDCSLRFYFSYVAGIREEDEVAEEIDAQLLGSLYHRAMEFIYEEMTGKGIEDAVLKKLSAAENVEKHLNRAFADVFLRMGSNTSSIKPEGKNIVILEIIRRMVRQTLEVDKRFVPFVYVESEMEINDVLLKISDTKKVRIGGKIDRLDKTKAGLRVIDYKTGSVSLEFDSVDKLFERDSWSKNKNQKAVLQTFLYSFLYSAKNPGEKPLIPSVYVTRDLFANSFSADLNDKTSKQKVSNYYDYAEAFERNILSLVREIFDPLVSFTQTEDEERCRYCNYKDICHR